MHPPRILGILAAIAVLATGCTPSPGPTPVPVTPVPTCTPEFGGAPVACTPADYERMQQLDERYAEAERVYREVISTEEASLRALRTTVSPEAEALYDPAGPYLEHMRNYSAAVGAEGLVSLTGTYHVTRVQRHPLPPDPGNATLSIQACVDGRETVMTFSDGVKEPGTMDSKLVLFTETDGPRVWSTRAGEAEACS